MKALLKNYRQSPRKVRFVADYVRGKDVTRALEELDYIPRRASLAIKKLIASAIANAENNFNVNKDDLFIESISVDKGITMKRFRPGARGAAYRILKRTSNIALKLGLKGKNK